MQKQKLQNNTLAILVDTSPSMAIKYNDEKSLLDKINEVFNVKSGFLNTLKNYDIKIYSFSDKPTPVINSKKILFTQKGYSTNLVESLNSISQELKTVNLNSIIVFSDGQDSKLSNFLSGASDFEYPVNTVEINKAEIIKDIHIANAITEELSYLEHETEIEIVLKNIGFEGREIKGILLEEGKELLTYKYLLKNSGEEKFKIKFVPQSPGWHRYSFVIKPLVEEKVTNNNLIVFYMQVIHEKIKILYIQGSPNLDFKFIKRALEENKNIEIDFLVYKNKEEFYKLDKNFLNSFPDTILLNQYNVIIVSNVKYQYFKNSEISSIKNFVEKRGGGILFLTGENSTGYASSELEKILPVKFPAQNIFYSNLFRPALTRDGNIHPILKINNNAEINKKFWEDVPELIGCAAISSSKLGATILALNSEQKYNYAFVITMAMQEYGKGKSFFVNAEGLWRWSFLLTEDKENNESANKLWMNIISWLGKTEEMKNFKIQTDKKIYNIGDKIHVRASLNDKSFLPIVGAKIECLVKDLETDFKLNLILNDLQDIQGIYEGQTQLFIPSEAIVSAKAIYKQEVVGLDQLRISVVPPQEEYQNLEINYEGLKSLAASTGGSYFTMDNLSSLPEKIKNNLKGSDYLEKIELWDTSWYLIVFISLLALEWFLRKKKGLD